MHMLSPDPERYKEHVRQYMRAATDPGVASSITVWSHTFAEIDNEIISTAILLPSAESRRVVVSYKRKYVHEVLVNLLVKVSKKKSGYLN